MLLQSVGWTGMMIKYSEQATFREAVAKTFDGKHPCGICKIVKRSQQADKQSDSQQIKVKVDFFVQTSRQFLFPMPVFPPRLALLPDHSLLRQSPPSPPPRVLPG